MARISFNDDDGKLSWFDPDAAQVVVSEGRYWNGNNWVGVGTGLQISTVELYLTKGGRWIEHINATMEFNGGNTYRFLSDADARAWLIKSADAQRGDEGAQEALDAYFPDVEEETGPPPQGGRPAIGPTINVAYPRELLDKIEKAADEAGLSRAAWLRRIAADAVS